MASTMAGVSLGLAPRVHSFAPRPIVGARSRLVIRAEQKPLTEKVDEIGQEIADYTKKSSGLNEDILGAKNRPRTAEVPSEASEALSFSGLLPETINGRAAMLAMLAAFGAELGTHRSVFQQIQSAPFLIAGAFATVVIGSIVPVVRKADLSAQGAGPFTQRAEIWNGRLAMVAFALLLTVETWKRGTGLVP